MTTPRLAHACVALSDNAVLVAGGEIEGKRAGTVELFNPDRGSFEPIPATLSAPRTRYAVAVLADGRVLIAGGTTDGHSADNLDLFDPERRSVYPAGHMLSPRANFTATLLPDGSVLLAGGTDGVQELASTEIYDLLTGATHEGPSLAAARQGHLAVFPRGAKAVLLAGGEAARYPVDSAERYIPAQQRFEPVSPLSNPAKTLTGGVTVTVAAVDLVDSAVRKTRTYSLP
jgi:hypothetical protein